VKGGDDYAQLLVKKYPIPLNSSFHAGYITLHCALVKEGKEVATGTEQVLLVNRVSFSKDLLGKTGAVYHWDAAQKAIEAAKGNVSSFTVTSKKLDYLVAGEVADKSTFKEMLKNVNEGTTLVIRFDSLWAIFLYQQKILKTEVKEWGGYQKPFWTGNGWGYLDTYLGNQAIPSKTCIGTNSWEVPKDPKGFYPFESNYPQQSQGAFFFRPDKFYTLMGTIKYGKGKIILAPSYFVDENQAFNDLLFFKLITAK
jgi:beta-galactosidase